MITFKILSSFYADCAMCVADLTTAGLACAPAFSPACITEGLIDNVGCVECITDFNFTDLINPFGFLPYEARAEICQKFGWLFERFEDIKISF